MCCFSRRIESVSNTNIFARSFSSERQALVYNMVLDAGEELAMILPIPVRPHSGEKAVRFVSLEAYPNVFGDMEKGFPKEEHVKGPLPRGLSKAHADSLEVVEVGSFEASFVPTIQDFDRLSERFRLPTGTWDQLPAYKDYGFAVFKLKPGAKIIHPMAFDFPRADPYRLFFPTVHIHDGKVHNTALFDHALYCQKMPQDRFSLAQWKESPEPCDRFMKLDKSAGIMEPATHCYQMKIVGRKKNADTWIG